jgi:hypothetical protein
MKQFDRLRSQGWLPLPRSLYRVLALSLSGVVSVIAGRAVNTKAGTDIITFVNGDQLTGTVVSVSGGTVMFHSDMSGDIKVSWDKVKSLRTTEAFAVIRAAES